jgi:hypothetical protein
MPEQGIERDYSRADENLQRVFPDRLLQRGDGLYHVVTRFEGDSATSRLIHSPSDLEVGHLSWDTQSGNIHGTDIDTGHALMGVNAGRLLRESWKTAATMGSAGPTYGQFADRATERLRQKVIGDNFNSKGSSTVVGAGYAPDLRESRGEATSDVFPSGVFGRNNPQLIEQRADTFLASLRQNYTDNAILGLRQGNNTREVATRLDPNDVSEYQNDLNETERDAEVNRHENDRTADNQINYSRITVAVNGTPKSFDDAVGREPTDVDRSVTGRDGFCSVCNNHGKAVAVTKIPYSGPADWGAISRHVMDSLSEPRTFTYSSMATGTRLAHPLGGRTFQNSIEGIGRHTIQGDAVHVNPEVISGGNVNGLTARIPITCSCSR